MIWEKLWGRERERCFEWCSQVKKEYDCTIDKVLGSSLREVTLGGLIEENKRTCHSPRQEELDGGILACILSASSRLSVPYTGSFPTLPIAHFVFFLESKIVWKHDSSINSGRETSVSPAEHDGDDDEL